MKLKKTSNIDYKIIKDTIIFNQKDSVYIKSNELSELTNSIKKIENHFNTHLNTKKDTFLGVSPDTIFTVTITFFIFFLGIIIDRIIKRYNKKKELEELKIYFIDQINDCKRNTLPYLIKAYKDFYQNIISIDRGYPTNAPKILSNDYNRLINLEITSLFKSFEDKSHFHKYLTQIDFLENLNIEIEKFHLIILKRNEILRSEISEIDTEFIKLLYKFIEYEFVNNPNYKEEFSYYEAICYYLEVFNMEIAKQNKLSKFNSEILKPIQKYLIATELNIHHPIGIKIYDKIREFNHKYKKLRILVIETRLQYRYFASNTEYSLKKLNEI